MLDPAVTQLTGSRVVLRDWRRNDLAPYREWLQPHHEWHAWDGPYFPRPTDAQAEQRRNDLRRRIDADDWPTPRTTLVIADRVSDLRLGSVTWYYESEETDWRRIGVVLYDPRSWSGGRGTEAVARWADYLFSATEIVRLDFATWSGNSGMCRIGGKLGWTEQARFRDARVVRGQRYDSVVYGVLRDEWVGRTGPLIRSRGHDAR